MGSEAPLREAERRARPFAAGPAPTLRPRRPPEEAYAACRGRSGGSSCTVTFPERTLAGSCVAPPNGDGGLACLPADFGRRELSGRELEQKLDRLEREIQGSSIDASRSYRDVRERSMMLPRLGALLHPVHTHSSPTLAGPSRDPRIRGPSVNERDVES